MRRERSHLHDFGLMATCDVCVRCMLGPIRQNIGTFNGLCDNSQPYTGDVIITQPFDQGRKEFSGLLSVRDYDIHDCVSYSAVFLVLSSRNTQVMLHFSSIEGKVKRRTHFFRLLAIRPPAIPAASRSTCTDCT